MPIDKFVMKIADLFSKKKWSKEDFIEPIISYAKTRSDAEREMLFDLLQNFIIYNYEQYRSELLKILKLIPQKRFANISNIYIIAVVDFDNPGRTKSSSVLTYLFQDTKIKHLPLFNKIPISIISPNDLASINIWDSLIIVPDDFVGTGDTFCNFYNGLKSLNGGLSKEKIIFLFIIGMEHGINILKTNNFEFYYNDILKKGITDIQNLKKRNLYYQLMDSLESEHKIGSKMHYGYGQSEGLIKMIRTPNNTFPIFWHENNPLAPFPR